MSYPNPESSNKYMHNVDVGALHESAKQRAAPVTLKPAVPYAHDFDIVKPAHHAQTPTYSGNFYNVGDVITEVEVLPIDCTISCTRKGIWFKLLALQPNFSAKGAPNGDLCLAHSEIPNVGYGENSITKKSFLFAIKPIGMGDAFTFYFGEKLVGYGFTAIMDFRYPFMRLDCETGQMWSFRENACVANLEDPDSTQFFKKMEKIIFDKKWF